MQEQTTTTVAPAVDEPATDDLTDARDEAAAAEIQAAADQDTPAADQDGPAAGQDQVAVDQDPGAGVRQRWRDAAGWTLTALAALFVLFALLLPNKLLHQTPWAFVRLPVELLIGLAAMLAVRPAVRRWAAWFVGVGLGLLIIVKVADIGFYSTLGRPFNLVLDWILLDDAVSFLEDSVGRVGGIASVLGIVLLAAGLVALAALSVRRVTRVAAEHSTATIRTVLVLGVVWVTLAAFGVQIHDAVPVATRNTISLLHARTTQVRAALQDKEAFAKAAAVDRFRGVPANQLLTALRGKDVIFTFIESYGRSAIEDPKMAPVVDPVLDAGTRDLKAAGFSSRSAFLTSPTAGGGSWLAHSTLMSGLWIDTQQRYRTLLASDRLSLTRCFTQADWRTVGLEPGTVRPFPEGAYYGYDKTYMFKDFGYQGPRFSWSTMPDQFALQSFQNLEYGKPGRGPLMAGLILTSSHTPWAPLPKTVGWDELGDGSIFGPIKDAGDTPAHLWKSRDRVRTAYAQSVAYSVHSLVSYVERYGKDNLVLVFLGDHQPSPWVTGEGASRDVPIAIVAHDPAVLDRIAGWHWEDGINPSPKAPVLRMDKFRDRFLTAFGPGAAH